jgi:hypothetical protein
MQSVHAAPSHGLGILSGHRRITHIHRRCIDRERPEISSEPRAPGVLRQAVVGVSLGASCVLRMTEHRLDRGWHPTGVARTIVLPRRSIYVMSGDARVKWKHAISKVRS